ncbi:F-box only protein 15-like isoform X2 [Siniperca chuatsi]|uniref:F-box only protein 15-like isoform X2 n=1 Tax=Siniperca chuatsi TaxID=119488 RepID=UPI001CE1A07C|nr:F-box only protein 15-like isoform X2 [Siniperca chuatsi]
MAAGRGEFFRSFLEGLERKPEQPAPGRRQPGRGRGKPAAGVGQSGPGKGQPGGKRKKKRPPKAAPSSVSGNDHSCPELQKTDFPQIKPSPCEEGLMERLPSEILIKILSYLDASSLFCISHVSKLFHQLANDDVMWHKIYMSEFASQTWKPKSADDAALKVDPVEDRLAGHWKKMYFRTMAGQEMNKWRRELRDISPYTGLPRQTEWVLRNLNVSWELTVRDLLGRELTLEQSRAYFFESSVVVRWSGGSFPKYHHISNIQLHGVRKEKLKSPKVRKPGWRSLILKLDMKTQRGRFIGKDRLIKLMHLSPGFIIGIWRGQNSVAFIMVSLHFHKLVERSLLGSPVCPYSEPVDLPPVDNSDPEFGLHGYTLHFVLHNTGTEIMSGHFRQLSCHTDPAWTGGAEGHQQDQLVPAQIAVWKHQTALEERGTGGLSGELLHHNADSAGRVPETLLVCQLTHLHHDGEEDAVLRLQRRALSDGVPELRRSGEDEAGLVEGAEAVLPHQPHRLRFCFQSQQAFQQRLLKLNRFGL